MSMLILRLGMVALSLAATVSAARACDTRHFYNHSDVNFTVTFPGLGACSSNANPGNVKSCVIAPGETGELHYSDLGNTIKIESVYFNKSFNAKLFSCFLEHDGNTGNVVLNDPADGDVQTCGHATGGTYDCSN